jgi:5-oxoprolinase (ATP-hydrolysing)
MNEAGLTNTAATKRDRSMWEFAIDVGGTFTDCIARSPNGDRTSCKVLSSGVTKGRVDERLGPVRFQDAGRRGEPPDFWVGYTLRLLDSTGGTVFESTIAGFEPNSGVLTTTALLPDVLPDECSYELASPEESPVLAIRRILELPLSESIPAVVVRLGTTRGTNALLTRGGGRTALITTRGFADALRIGDQARPRLFDLTIRKPPPLFETVVEADERIDAHGRVLQSLDAAALKDKLQRLKSRGIACLAIVLMNAYANPEHERLAERLARDVGFEFVQTSTATSPLIKFVPRGETTVLDAYLAPVLQAYLSRLRRQLAGSHLRLMTSSGGLVPADRFSGKESVLSGPAGGVIGCARVGAESGFPRCIGLDMGGTSTDVTRCDGRGELEYESLKAGVRLSTPMVSVETIAAGGGSLCRFDGVKLVVGPQSAGSNPGPACYGRGGPLTMTDVNLFLGRIPVSRFPFPLNRAAVVMRLEEIRAEMHAAGSRTELTLEQLASGFVDVANASMVRAIRTVSVARGCDPREFALVPFGGAGGQHACALARELGMRSIVAHPHAGLLSAYGIGLSPQRRFAVKNILQPFSPDSMSAARRILDELGDQVRAELLADGAAESSLADPIRMLDLRYRGVDAVITVPQPVDGDFAAEYERQHLQRFGYHRPGREVEIVAARVEGATHAEPLPRRMAIPMLARNVTPTEFTETVFAGVRQRTPVFVREALRPGDEIRGPAIVCEPGSTLVIDPGFVGYVDAGGCIVLTDRAAPAAVRDDTAVDPVRLEIFNNQFASIAEEMGAVLRQTSLSTNVKERLDFSCAIFTADGDLVVNAPHIPVHLGAMGETVKSVLAECSPLHPGDIVVTNDPYRGGSHLPDVTVVTPVHDPRGGGMLFLTASRAHHAEIGGIVPGSMPPFSRSLAEEGVLLRHFKLRDAGVSRETELTALLSSGPNPSRSVAENLADIAAQAAANQTGARRLLELIDRAGWPTVSAYMRHIQAAAETRVRQALSRIPAGVYRFADQLDDGTPITVSITIRDAAAVVDFTGTGPVSAGNLNANRAIVTAAVMYVFRCLLAADIPLNSGVLAPVRIVLPEGLLNPPRRDNPAECAAIVGGNVETSQRVVDVLLGALQLAAASQGTMNNFTFGNESFGYYETICGGSGATSSAPGCDAVHTHMTNTRLTDPEILERRYPVRLRRFAVRSGSGGAGRHRGGDGVVREIEFLQPVRVSILSERRGPASPFGLAGGLPGSLGRNSLRKASDGSETDLGGKSQLDVQPGDLIRIETPGGGGWGEPERGSIPTRGSIPD